MGLLARSGPLATVVIGVAAPVVGAAVAGPVGAQEADLDGVGFVLGSDTAPVTVVEYADFACSACGIFARDTWPTLRRDYIETGRVRWRTVPFELGFRHSDEAARAAQCGAELGAFWVLHDALFERQAEWLDEGRPKEALLSIAGSAGLDEASFRACYDEDLGQDRRKDANRAARSDAIRGTPTFFIDGHRVQGALPLETFVALIEAAERR